MIVEEFWIFLDNWEPFVHFSKDSSDSNYFIYQQVEMNNVIGIQKLISQNFSSKGLNPIGFQNHKYILGFCFRKNIKILLKTEEFNKDKEIIKISKTLCNMVENLYCMEDFINWNKNISIFEILKKRLNLFSKMSNL